MVKTLFGTPSSPAQETKGETQYVSTNLETRVTIRVTFDPADENDSPKNAIEEGKEEAIGLMGWFDASPVDDEPIHFWRAAWGQLAADVIYEERPVTMDRLPKGARQV